MTSSSLTLRALPLTMPQLDYILVDGSGSMASKWWDCMDALDSYVTALRTAHVPTQLIAAVFDSRDVAMLQRNEPIADWISLRERPLTANFTITPLFDAINAMGRHLRDLDPPRCAITIVTDGEENASQYTDETQARAILDWCRAHGWTVTFIGCDFNNSQQARALGASDRNSLGVQRALFKEAGKLLADKRIRYGAGADDIEFSDEEKTSFGGYLAAS